MHSVKLEKSVSSSRELQLTTKDTQSQLEGPPAIATSLNCTAGSRYM